MSNKKIILAAIATLMIQVATAQISNYTTTVPVNYVKVYEPQAPYTTTADVISTTRTVEQVKRSTQYFDGLGRPIQTVGWQVTPLKKDMVSVNVYDAFGREAQQYLPYIATTNDGLLKYNAATEHQTFNTTMYGLQGETFFYSQTNFEPSPLNRPVKSMAAGNSWVGNNKGVEQQFQINTINDGVRKWDITNINGAMPTTSEVYPTGELYKNVAIDEHGKQVVEYKDKEGKVILKQVQIDNTIGNDHTGYLNTYYVYDVFGNLRFVIQPKAVQQLKQNNWTFASVPNSNNGTIIRDELCFYYEYDNQGRMIIKKVPGAGEVHMVYDERDRLVMTQDANLRSPSGGGGGKWMVTLYDELNRPYKTGLWMNTSTRATHQLAADAQTTTIQYPLLTSITSTNFDLLTETGYDNYTALPTASGLVATLDNSVINSTNFVTTYNTAPQYAQQITASTATKGMPTWTMVKVLNGASNPQYLYTLTIYDEYGRPIQTKATNITGGTDIATMQYDFSGKILRTHQQHQKAGNTPNIYQVLTKPSYDHMGRVLDIKKTISATGSPAIPGTEKIIAQNTYNELGQLKTKKLAPAFNSGAGLENLNYDYNIRGWLLGMNRGFINSSPPPGGGGGGFFGFELGYDKANNIIAGQSYTQQQYNGNISGTTWKTKGDSEIRKFDYGYDNANRLLKADFNQYTSGSFNQNANINFNVKMGDGNDYTTAYDENGNIKQMQQWGLKGLSSTQIDNLAYNYTEHSNKLLNVIDATNDANTKLSDFRASSLYISTLPTKNNTTIDYTYDANGNLIKDKNKDIETFEGADGIEYNYLNLPQKITVKANNSANKGTIEYVYDATGNKLQKKTTEGSTVTTTTYTSGYVYESKTGVQSANDVLQFTGHEEGRVRPTFNTSNVMTGFVYDYMLKDHLGNVRMLLTEEQKQDVYPAATLENATHEGGTAISVENQFYTIDATKIVNKPKTMPVYQNNNGNPPYNNNPYSNTTANSARVYKTNAAVNKIGLGITLKVMAGDNVDIFGKSSHYAPAGEGYNNPVSPVSVLEILNNMVSTNTMNPKGFTGSQLQPNFPSSVGNIFSGYPTQESNRPQASINWIIFDEQFKYVNGGFDVVGKADPLTWSLKSHQKLGIAIPKNGYIYVYCSNESNYDVFFDNLQLIHNRGPILEETHYYPFGLTMAGISSKAAGGIQNKIKFNGGNELQSNEFSDGSGLELYDAFFRMYDAQIGRFHRVDPLADFFEFITPYSFAFNDPIYFNDPSGLSPNAENGPKVLSDWIVRGGKIIFDPLVNGSNDPDLKPGDEYLAPQIKITNSNGEVYYGLEDGSLTWDDPGWGQLESATVVGTRKKKAQGLNDRLWEATKLGANGTEFLYQTTSYLMKNDFGWHDAKGNWHFMKELEKRTNGKYVIGVQGKRLSLKSASQVADKFKGIAKKAGVVGMAFDVYDVVNDGKVTAGETAKLAINTVAAASGPWGWIYLGVDITVAFFNDGKGVTDMIADKIDEKTGGASVNINPF